MITQRTKLELLPESIQKKWSTEKERQKQLMYVEDVECITIETADEMLKMQGGLLADPTALIGFDTEATSARAESAEIVGMSFAIDDYRGFYVPVGHKYGKQVPLEDALEIVAPILQARLSMAGGKFDWHVMRRYGVDVRWGMDSQVMSRLLGEVEYGVGLKPTVARMFGERMIEFSDVVTAARQKKGETFADVEIGMASLYAVPDAIYTRRVSMKAMREMPDVIKQLLLRVDHEAMRIAGEMEWVGAPLDKEYLERHREAGRAMAETLRHEAIEGLKAVAVRRGRKAEEIPDDLNLNSSNQMQSALFDVCGFKPVKKSPKTGKPSADKQSIEKMAERDPEVDWVRRYRSCTSRVGDIDEMLDFGIHADNWFWVHGSLNPTGGATGRWTSSGPNLQNMKKGASVYESRNSKWEMVVRDAVMAPPGYYIVTADYSQVELRVAAGESKCRAWLDAFASGHDVHSASAAAIYGIPIEQVTAKQRAVGKTFNFALLFGQEVKATAQVLGITVAEAQRLQNAFWAGLPEVKSWVSSVHSFVRQHKYVETHFGRRRWLRGIDSDNKWIVLQNLRESVNTIVQGTAADIFKIGLMRAESTWKAFGAKLFLVVHDQYVWLVPETSSPGEFCRAMDGVINFDVPGYPTIVSDYSIGERFDEYSSLVGFDSAAEVPDTWEAAFSKEAVSADSGEEDILHVEVDAITMPEMLEFTRLVEANPGQRKVVLSVTGLSTERTLNFRTGLGTGDELKIRAAVGSTARVSLV